VTVIFGEFSPPRPFDMHWNISSFEVFIEGVVCVSTGRDGIRNSVVFPVSRAFPPSADQCIFLQERNLSYITLLKDLSKLSYKFQEFRDFGSEGMLSSLYPPRNAARIGTNNWSPVIPIQRKAVEVGIRAYKAISVSLMTNAVPLGIGAVTVSSIPQMSEPATFLCPW
jgi:hypothetical protein